MGWGVGGGVWKSFLKVETCPLSPNSVSLAIRCELGHTVGSHLGEYNFLSSVAHKTLKILSGFLLLACVLFLQRGSQTVGQAFSVEPQLVPTPRVLASRVLGLQV